VPAEGSRADVELLQGQRSRDDGVLLHRLTPDQAAAVQTAA
jgi:hypothetical protein